MQRLRFSRAEWTAFTVVWAVWAALFAGAGVKATGDDSPEARRLHIFAGLSLFAGVACLRRTGKQRALFHAEGEFLA